MVYARGDLKFVQWKIISSQTCNSFSNNLIFCYFNDFFSDYIVEYEILNELHGPLSVIYSLACLFHLCFMRF